MQQALSENFWWVLQLGSIHVQYYSGMTEAVLIECKKSVGGGLHRLFISHQQVEEEGFSSGGAKVGK